MRSVLLLVFFYIFLFSALFCFYFSFPTAAPLPRRRCRRRSSSSQEESHGGASDHVLRLPLPLTFSSFPTEEALPKEDVGIKADILFSSLYSSNLLFRSRLYIDYYYTTLHSYLYSKKKKKEKEKKGGLFVRLSPAFPRPKQYHHEFEILDDDYYYFVIFLDVVV